MVITHASNNKYVKKRKAQQNCAAFNQVTVASQHLTLLYLTPWLNL